MLFQIKSLLFLIVRKILWYFENNKLINDIAYLNNDEFEELLKKYPNYIVILNEHIDIEKIYDYLKDKEGINPHNVNPYIYKEDRGIVMISKYSKEDINDIENLGQEVNPKFKELFHINNLKRI